MLKNQNVLIILRGAPGAGKTTFANILVNNAWNDFVVVSADNYMVDKNGDYKFDANRLSEVHQKCYELSEAYMSVKLDVILDNTNTKEEHFEKYIELAKKYNYDVFSIVIENRHSTKSVHNVPEETVLRHAEQIKNSLKLF